jgi:hypothetical protein
MGRPAIGYLQHHAVNWYDMLMAHDGKAAVHAVTVQATFLKNINIFAHFLLGRTYSSDSVHLALPNPSVYDGCVAHWRTRHRWSIVVGTGNDS